MINANVLKIIFLSFILPITAFTHTVEPDQMRIMAVGDIMMHKPVTNAGYNHKTSMFQFDSFFSEVKPIFSTADYVIGNLETPIAGKEHGFTGYPRFNGPKEMVLALKNAGVNVLTTANNHAMDQGHTGIQKTIEVLREYQVLHTGTFTDETDRNKVLILEKNGFKVGLVAYTYGTNGLKVPSDKSYLVNKLNINEIRKDIERLREHDVDYVIAMIHYGVEYRRVPTQDQIDWTTLLHDIGIDFVIGSHPHVVQPMNILRNEEGVDRGVIYSLGNFLSNQSGNWKDYGVILNLLLEKKKGKTVTIKEVEVIPTYVDRSWDNGKRQYKIRPLIEESPDMSKGIYDRGQELIEHVMGQ